MTVLERQSELADQLIAKLERIKELSAALPSAEELDECAGAAGRIAANLEQAASAWNAEHMPTTDELNECAGAAGGKVCELLEDFGWKRVTHDEKTE